MNAHTSRHVMRRLGQALAIGAVVAASPWTTAQERTPLPEPGAAQPVPPMQDPAPAKPEPAAAAQQSPLKQEPTVTPEPALRTTVTGSHITRVRREPTLPTLLLDRAYIDQSGATTPAELIRSLPQAQSGR